MAALNDSVLKPVQELTAVSFNASSATTSTDAIPGNAGKDRLVQVLATERCHIAPPLKSSYASGAATNTNSMPIEAWVPMVFKVPVGAKLSVIGNIASGKLFITLMD